MNELNSVSSSGSLARDSTHYLREALKTPIYEAAEHTPLQEMPALSTRLDSTAEAKREDLQTVHSLKIHDAYNAMCSLNSAERERGAATASAGNYAQGVTRPAAPLGMNAIIVMPIVTPQIKVDAVRALGGEVRLHGDNFDAAKVKATRLVEAEDLSYIASSGDPRAIVGQGTIGLRPIQQGVYLDRVFVPVGSGGPATGVAVLIKQLMPGIKVIGVEHEGSACPRVALLDGEPVILHHVGLSTEGAAVRRVDEETFRMCQALLDDVVTVSPDETFAVAHDIFDDMRVTSKPSGVLAPAGLERYAAEHHLSGGRLVFVLSGASLNLCQLRYISERSETSEQCEAILGVTIPEEQGSFLRSVSALGAHPAIEFNYHFSAARVETDSARIFAGVCIARRQERAEIVVDLKKAGYDVIDLTDDELAKAHTRSMIGGCATPGIPEHLFSFLSPESPGALAYFLEVPGTRWNITLFHYRTDGTDCGCILYAFAIGPDDVELTGHMDRLGHFYNEEIINPAFRFLLAR